MLVGYAFALLSNLPAALQLTAFLLVSQKDDGFLECPSEGCAQSQCIDFLRSACPPVQIVVLESLYNKACTLVPPSPPSHPPPQVTFTLRERDAETDSDGECQLVSHADCKQIVSDYAARTGVADVMQVSFAPCEGLADEVDCFVVRTKLS